MPPIADPARIVATEAERRAGSRSTPSESGSGSGGGSGASPAAPSDETTTTATPSDARSNLEVALARAFGTPTSCLSEAAREAMGERLSLHVTVRVLGSGRVTEGNVSGGGLPAADLACLGEHARSLRLAGPIDGAPRTITTRVEYAVQDTRTTTTETVAPDRGLHAGTLNADRTLEAAGTARERPAGSVAPSLVLPGEGSATKRPPGFVPPSSTLPAQGAP